MVSVADQRTGLSRVTLVGERRRVDMVLPAEEPIGELLPDVLRLLGDKAADRPALRRLVTPGGAVLAQDDTLASAGVADGAVLRLVRQQETPAAPVVHDVTDEAADDLDVRGWRWGDRTRTWTAGTAHVLLGLVAAVCARLWLGADAVGPWLLAAAGAASAIGAVTARLGGREPGTALMVLGGALGAYGSWTATDGAAVRLAALGAVLALSLVLLGVCAGAGRGALVGAGAVAVVVGGWELALAVTDAAGTGLVLGLASVLALGHLPRLALMGAGLTRLDDQRAGGASVSRHRVDAALAATHRGLALATVVTGLSAAAGGWLAVSGPEATAWEVTATALFAVVLLSRSRAYPLAVEVVALLAAGTVLAVRLFALWGGAATAAPPAALAAVALVPLAVLVLRPPDHVRVRLRRTANLVESVSVVVLIPVVIGAFGVYGRLLNTF
ncbi:EsaB/YukD family protein [Streptomyces chumphonensis]|uniref:EsaB/YukD family protein n=1 Tax=Streptomyces chumphonensis TaxID=1214925 RepID=UPI003D712A24